MDNDQVVKASNDPKEHQEKRWEQILSFMRNNPKLLMQMIPDGAIAQVANDSDIVIKRSRIHEKIQEAQ